MWEAYKDHRLKNLNGKQSTLRPPDVRIVYRKTGIYMVHMEDNDMHGARADKKRGHKHSPSQLELKALLGSIQGKYS